MANPKGNPNWQPGQSGNPNGRPRKERTLTKALQTALNKSVDRADGSKIAGRQYVASLVSQGLQSGKIVLADGSIIICSPEDILKLLNFVFNQIDGPPPRVLEHTGENGGPITLKIIKGAEVDDL